MDLKKRMGRGGVEVSRKKDGNWKRVKQRGCADRGVDFI